MLPKVTIMATPLQCKLGVLMQFAEGLTMLTHVGI